LKKDFDNTIKGNVYIVEGQKVLVNPSAAGGGDKKEGKVEIVHRYLVIQMYLASGDSFSLELQVRDKQNVSPLNV
jgi:Protein of unknown function (DUF667)